MWHENPGEFWGQLADGIRTAVISGTQLTFTAQIRTFSVQDDRSTVRTVCVRLRYL